MPAIHPPPDTELFTGYKTHLVPHISTIPKANENKPATLFVAEYDGTPHGSDPQIVLMVHGRSVPALASFDLGGHGPALHPDPDRIDYSWAHALENAGLDVFVMDLQGSGLSERPLMGEPCNASPSDQAAYLNAECNPQPGQAHQLTNTDTDVAEITTVVNYIRRLDGKESVAKVSLVGYSLGAAAVGPFTLRNPKLVDRLFLLAPIFRPDGPSDPEAPLPLDGTFPDPKGEYAAGQFGYPMFLQDSHTFFTAWHNELNGAKQDTIPESVVWDAIMSSDYTGSRWGTAGVMRIRNHYWWGWNKATAGALFPEIGVTGGVTFHPTLGKLVPVMIMYGSADTQANHDPHITGSPPKFRTSVPDLYNTIPGDQKLMVEVPGTGHFMPWETQRKVLHQFSAEWIKFGYLTRGWVLPLIWQGSYKLASNGVLEPVP